MAAEILAPAGGKESLIAAVRCGADAVYFGGKAFNARRNAENFSDEELKEAADYCRKRGVKVCITLNTLVFDDELPAAYGEIKAAAQAGADALIIQDLGVLRLARQVCPSMPLHASTQMSVQSAYGVNKLAEMGFSRAVLPRELSEKEISEIARNTDIELEHFIHGAQCMCLSGQCLMSSVIGGRSGNRGLCAQPCRLPFGVNGGTGYNLSLKDMSLIDKAQRLVDAGVYSLKIEGRMKRPEYVAAAVTACRNALDGKEDREIANALSAVFSRQGFTSGYFDGKTGKEMFGVRTKDDVEAASPVLGALAKLYEKENPLIAVELEYGITPGKAFLTARAMGKTCTADTAEVSPSINKEATSEEAEERFSKTGGTQFFVKSISGFAAPGLYISASEMNSLRRKVLAQLEEEIAYAPKKDVKQFNFTRYTSEPAEPELHLRFFRESQIPVSLQNVKRVIVPPETGRETVARLKEKGIEVAGEVPVNVFSNAELYLEKLKALKEYGADLAWCANIDGTAIAEKAGLPFACGFGMNIANSFALMEAGELGARDALLSCELSAAKMKNLYDGLCKGVMLYGKLPLMVTRNCPVKNEITCDRCGGKSFLRDRTGADFPVVCKYGSSFILNSVPMCNFDRKDVFPFDYHLLYFTNESQAECEEIIKMYFKGNNPPVYTRGLYFRNVM